MINPPGASVILDQYLEEWAKKLAVNCIDQEQEALLECVRSVDLHSYLLHFFAASDFTADFRRKCIFIQRGIGLVLHSLLPQLDQYGDGIPLFPSIDKNEAWADYMLEEAGKLLMLRRLAYGERYNLTRTKIHSEKHVSIHIEASNMESSDIEDHTWMVNRVFGQRKKIQEQLDSEIKGWALDRIDLYVRVWRDHFIEYDSDWELHQLYRKQAENSLIRSPEADSLPEDVKIGPMTFGEWKNITIMAVARAMLHISFATRLQAKNPNLNLRNLLTIHIRQEDLRAVWSQQTGITGEAELDDISDIFMLTTQHAKEYYLHNDFPLPYNLRFGKYFALLPQFGQLGNACTFLVTELRRKYREDWDKAVNKREALFQQDLYALLPEPCHIKGRENVVLRASSKTTSTDIDAVLFERSSNCIYLFQLKWFDVFGLRLKERQSKLTNLLDKGTEWIDRVQHWLSTVPRKEVVKALALDQYTESQTAEIRLVILTRHSAQFSGPHKYDERAAWISWPTLYRAVSETPSIPFSFDAIWNKALSLAKKLDYLPEGICTTYKFLELQVDVWE